MSNLQEAKDLKVTYNNGDCDDFMWEGIKKEAKELLEEVKQERKKSDNFKGTSNQRDDIFEAIKILEEILKP